MTSRVVDGHAHDGLTTDALDALLTRLDGDRDRAGERYVVLRRKLEAFFRWRGVSDPEECADRTLNVAARKLAEGEEVRDVGRYCAGIARMVLLETFRRTERERATLEEISLLAPVEQDGDEGRRAAACEACLRDMSTEDRDLVLSYYGASSSERIALRKKLAARMGISLNTLRVRAFRIRARLEEAARAAIAGTDLRR